MCASQVSTQEAIHAMYKYKVFAWLAGWLVTYHSKYSDANSLCTTYSKQVPLRGGWRIYVGLWVPSINYYIILYVHSI